MYARIFQINTSRGGVPKRAVPAAEIGIEGITTDKQRDRRHHGGPERALALFALETILELQQEGHPIFPGSTGENITTIGIDQASLVPGVRLQLGDFVIVEVMSYCSPCTTIIDSFAGGNFNRISQKLHPGQSRVYVRIIQTGHIRVGDEIRLLAHD